MSVVPNLRSDEAARDNGHDGWDAVAGTPGSSLTPQSVGPAMYDLIARLFPICRSITGNGVRQTLAALSELVPLVVHEVPSGTRAFDWVVPREWNIRDAYIKDANGRRVVDFRASNLHVVNYSVPVRAVMTLE